MRTVYFSKPNSHDLTDGNLLTWHGMNSYGLRSAILRGLTNSVDERGRHAYRGVGVYSSPCIEVASYYATPHNVFEDGRYWQTFLRLSSPRAKTKSGQRFFWSWSHCWWISSQHHWHHVHGHKRANKGIRNWQAESMHWLLPKFQTVTRGLSCHVKWSLRRVYCTECMRVNNPGPLDWPWNLRQTGIEVPKRNNQQTNKQTNTATHTNIHNQQHSNTHIHWMLAIICIYINILCHPSHLNSKYLIVEIVSKAVENPVALPVDDWN